MKLSDPYIIIGGIGLNVAAIFILLNSTDPTKNISSILLVFLLLYIFFVVLTLGVFQLVGVWREMGEKGSFSLRRRYYYSIVVAFIPVGLLAMQSLHQVRTLDIFLIVVLVGLVIFYIHRRT